MDVVLPTPPFWLAMVMTRIRPGVGKGSWSAACRTRVARRASMAMGLSKSPHPAGRRGRLVSGETAPQPLARVGHRGSFLPAAFHVERSRVAVPVPRGTADGRAPASARRHRAPRVVTTTVLAASPGMYRQPAGARPASRRPPVRGPSPGAPRCAAAPTRATSWPPGPQQTAAPADQPGERRDRPGGDDVDGARRRRTTDRSSARPRTTRHIRPGPRELGHPLVEELHPAGHRLHQRQDDVRTGQPQRYAGQTRAAADVDHPGARGTASATAALLSTCRSHSRGTSRGPISPRSPVGRQPGDVLLRRAAAPHRRPRGRLRVRWTQASATTDVGRTHLSGRTTTRRSAPRPRTRCARRRWRR